MCIRDRLDGVLEKYLPGDAEFDVPQRLIDLHKAKDYGPYGVNGTLPVCFTSSLHTTGGNSGSPVLNGRGELIGLNFDRTWESTMSDIQFDPDKCCLLYTSDAADERSSVDLGGRRIIKKKKKQHTHEIPNQ